MVMMGYRCGCIGNPSSHQEGSLIPFSSFLTRGPSIQNSTRIISRSSADSPLWLLMRIKIIARVKARILIVVRCVFYVAMGLAPDANKVSCDSDNYPHQ